MFKKNSFTVLFVSMLLLTACNVPTAVPTAAPTTAIAQLPTIAPTETQVQLPTVEASGTPTVEPTLAPGALPDIGESTYLDDRSTPAALILSYFNAINQKEYLRVLSYFVNNTPDVTLADLTEGYKDTQSVNVVFGLISQEGAAGSTYFTVPMVLNSTHTSGTQEKFAACYILRRPEPGNYGAPPIQPMHIDKRFGKSVPLTTTDKDALAEACPADYPTGMNTLPAVVEQIDDLSSANFIDNRSDPVSLISSLLNAINRQEYVRAYSYWQTPQEAYNDFAAGYAQTASVTAQFGQVIDDPGAGQLNYSVPVKMISTLSDGTKQTFVGCYVLHLSQPGIQATPPFKPLGITNGTFTEVANNSDVNPLMLNICQ